ncbi:MAG: hypothetical protein GDA36_11915 [Rhodobacteraceae bacterium]|nr:hypothetical protein [Paracoccaceae bacterium]
MQPTCKRALGVPGSGHGVPRGYGLPVSVRSGTPKLAVRVCRQIEDYGPRWRSSMPHWWNVSHIDAPQNRTKAEEAPDDPPPTIQTCTYSADTVPIRKRGESGTAQSVRPCYEDEIQATLPARTRPGRGTFRGTFHRQGLCQQG